ncbi:DUF853 family protein [Leucobacter sp. OH2974_COT-288]|nr:DUF853 family protein [Leucobacter sp. OH2974_COT-288]
MTSKTEQQQTGPLTAAEIEKISVGYSFAEPALEMGALVNGEALPEVQIRIPIAMTNRHGLIAGATGTGKTRTLQVLLEQLSSNGVPVFAADIKGDLSGVATPGVASEKLLARTAGIGQEWQAAAAPVEYFSLGGNGHGVPIRATVKSFGPLLFAKVLGLNETQESSLKLIFNYAGQHQVPLNTIADLKAVLTHLTSPEGKAELAALGGVSKQTAGVILRELSNFEAAGAANFFGQPEMPSSEFLRYAADGRGIVSLLQIPGVAHQPEVFSTFLMWLLADLFRTLPEVGDAPKPKLVFFFDEAHLLFKDASKAFISQVVQTVRLIRSKGVGVFFITQSPKDLPNDVLAQLGSRVQHQLRAHTPDDAAALKAAARTYPDSGYDLEKVLTELATGEAIVTVMNEKGAPTPTAWTRLRAPQGLMDPTPEAEIVAAVNASQLLPRYGTPVQSVSAAEILAGRVAAAQQAAGADAAGDGRGDRESERYRDPAPQRQAPAPRRQSTRQQKSGIEKVIGSRTGQTVIREVTRAIINTIFGKRR